MEINETSKVYEPFQGTFEEWISFVINFLSKLKTIGKLDAEEFYKQLVANLENCFDKTFQVAALKIKAQYEDLLRKETDSFDCESFVEYLKWMKKEVSKNASNEMFNIIDPSSPGWLDFNEFNVLPDAVSPTTGSTAGNERVVLNLIHRMPLRVPITAIDTVKMQLQFREKNSEEITSRVKGEISEGNTLPYRIIANTPPHHPGKTIIELLINGKCVKGTSTFEFEEPTETTKKGNSGIQNEKEEQKSTVEETGMLEKEEHVPDIIDLTLKLGLKHVIELQSFNVKEFDGEKLKNILSKYERDSCGFTMLMRLSCLGAEGLVKYILNEGIFYGDEVDCFQKRAVDWARYFSQKNVVRLLERRKTKNKNEEEVVEDEGQEKSDVVDMKGTLGKFRENVLEQCKSLPLMKSKKRKSSSLHEESEGFKINLFVLGSIGSGKTQCVNSIARVLLDTTLDFVRSQSLESPSEMRMYSFGEKYPLRVFDVYSSIDPSWFPTQLLSTMGTINSERRVEIGEIEKGVYSFERALLQANVIVVCERIDTLIEGALNDETIFNEIYFFLKNLQLVMKNKQRFYSSVDTFVVLTHWDRVQEKFGYPRDKKTLKKAEKIATDIVPNLLKRASEITGSRVFLLSNGKHGNDILVPSSEMELQNVRNVILPMVQTVVSSGLKSALTVQKLVKKKSSKRVVVRATAGGAAAGGAAGGLFGGIAIGATVGTIFGPVGTVFGGLVGSVVGAVGGGAVAGIVGNKIAKKSQRKRFEKEKDSVLEPDEELYSTEGTSPLLQLFIEGIGMKREEK